MYPNLKYVDEIWANSKHSKTVFKHFKKQQLELYFKYWEIFHLGSREICLEMLYFAFSVHIYLSDPTSC